MCREQKWSLATWDIDKGLQIPAQTAATASDAIAAIKSINSLSTPNGSALLVLPNFHRFMQSTEVVQALAHQITTGKTNRTFVLVLSPVVQIPVELEKQFVVVPPPGRQVQFRQPGRDGHAGQAGGVRHRRHAAPAQPPRLRGRPLPAHPFIHLRPQGLELAPNPFGRLCVLQRN